MTALSNLAINVLTGFADGIYFYNKGLTLLVEQIKKKPKLLLMNPP